MKFLDTIVLSVLFVSASAAPFQAVKRQTTADGLTLAQIDALTPPFGHDADVNPTGTGDCDGAVNDANGNPIKVPCDCPPPRASFIQVCVPNKLLYAYYTKTNSETELLASIGTCG